ncbi:MAG: glycosyltransferase family 2 protein [Anaerolineae bacterium]|nr:glycosyltransferase family 2 protein [Anaerolineae bacterium]
MKLSIIICVYNERKTILDAIHQAHAADFPRWEREIIVVDNFSTDGTRELVQEIDLPDVRVVLHPRNLGKGASVRTGIAEACGDYFVVFDADLEYEAEDLPRLAAEVVPGETVAVFGSRTSGGRRIYKYAKNYWGVRFLSTVTNLLYGSHLTDVAVGLKLVRLDVARALKLDGSDFDLDFELPCQLLKRGYKIREVPIAYHPRTFEEGKKLRAFHAGPGALWAIVKTRFVG